MWGGRRVRGLRSRLGLDHLLHGSHHGPPSGHLRLQPHQLGLEHVRPAAVAVSRGRPLTKVLLCVAKAALGVGRALVRLARGGLRGGLEGGEVRKALREALLRGGGGGARLLGFVLQLDDTAEGQPAHAQGVAGVLLELGELRLGREGALEGRGLLARLLLGSGNGGGERLAAELGLLEDGDGVLELDGGLGLWKGGRTGTSAVARARGQVSKWGDQRDARGEDMRGRRLTAATAFL